MNEIYCARRLVAPLVLRFTRVARSLLVLGKLGFGFLIATLYVIYVYRLGDFSSSQDDVNVIISL